MSNALLNYHVTDGSPCGKDATLSEIADYYGELLMDGDTKGNEDSNLLDYLQKLTNKAVYTGRVILRNSGTGRGWRLHESSAGTTTDVRQAIRDFIKGK